MPIWVESSVLEEIKVLLKYKKGEKFKIFTFLGDFCFL